MPALYRMLEQPEIESPVLVVMLKGWVDAGFAADAVMQLLVDELDGRVAARFDADALLDWRARRPVMRLVDGINADVSWEETELRWARDLGGNDVLLLAGHEPDQAWLAFSTQVADLAVDLGARMVVGLGAYPSPTPHTRTPLLAVSASDASLTTGFVRSSIEVPTGVQGLIERQVARRGLPVVGLWAQVPHYVSAMAYPAASLALLDGLERVAGLTLPRGDLEARAGATRARIDELIEQNPEHKGMVAQLEAQADQLATSVELSGTSGEELAAELERFLREHGTGP